MVMTARTAADYGIRPRRQWRRVSRPAARVFRALLEWESENACRPTQREIAAWANFATSGNMHRYLAELRTEGLVLCERDIGATMRTVPGVFLDRHCVIYRDAHHPFADDDDESDSEIRERGVA